MRLQWQQAWDGAIGWAAAWSEPAFDLEASPLVLTATVAASGDIGATVPVDGLQWAQAWSASLAWREAWFVDSVGRFDIDAQPIALAASVGVSGDIEHVIGVPWEFEPPLTIEQMSATVGITADLGYTIPAGIVRLSFPQPIAISANAGMAGVVQVVLPPAVPFDLAASPIAIQAGVTVAGDVQPLVRHALPAVSLGVSASVSIDADLVIHTRGPLMYPLAGKRQAFPLAGKRQF